MAKWAVITGASSGIGKEIAKLLSKRGYSLVLVARRRDKLEELEKELVSETEIISADLSERAECEKLMERLSDREVEVLINNAGFGDCGAFSETDIQKELNMIGVNVTAMHLLMKLMLKKMQESGKGYILNTASSAGLLPGGPYMATYYATKAYVTSITLAVARELEEAKSPVYVGCLCPGPVDTEFNAVANVEFALKGISAEYCADYAVKKMFKKKTIIVPSLQLKLAVFFSRFVSRKGLAKMAGSQQKKKLGK
ncbi:MAG: SDR family oxidoreductase [Lachnospiraceae bacterium]|nr:SDR family oxidoreductase [Lachnospiraceae bacterium]